MWADAGDGLHATVRILPRRFPLPTKNRQTTSANSTGRPSLNLKHSESWSNPAKT